MELIQVNNMPDNFTIVDMENRYNKLTVIELFMVGKRRYATCLCD